MKVLISDGMAKAAIQDLKDNGFEVTEQFYPPEELVKEIEKYDVIVVRSATKVTKEIIAAGKNLKLIVRGGVGIDNIDSAAAKEHSVKVMNTPAASSASVAELALAHIFAIARFLPQATGSMKAGQWEKKAFAKGMELGGKTLGLIGCGRIGIELAKRCKALEMKVLAYDKFATINSPYVEQVDLETILTKSDVISLHIPLPKGEPPVIGASEIAKMKNGAILVNCARGGTVDEAALIEALKSGKLRGAGVDVFVGEPSFNKDLVALPNVSVTPHIGASTVEAQDKVGAEVVSILIKELK
ncbi:MAG: D-2-hydroxyacid dehydrogenase [bacterium]|nr:D-2-hydroxyacid dehydrogenase [bacterium]